MIHNVLAYLINVTTTTPGFAHADHSGSLSIPWDNPEHSECLPWYIRMGWTAGIEVV